MQQIGTPSFRDMRRYARYQRDLPFVLRNARNQVLDNTPTLRDVSVDGLGFISVAKLSPGEEFRFQLQFPGPQGVAGTARVSWAQPDEIGLTCSYGAKIQKLNILHSYRMRKNLQPDFSDPLKIVDSVLMLACCVIFYKIIQSSPTFDPANFPGFEILVERLPFAFIIGGAGLGIWLHLRR